MSYLTTVLADSPKHYWRLADGGGSIAHDIGSDPFHLIAGGADMLGYSGPSSNGGSAFFPTGLDLNSVGASLTALTSPFSFEIWFWQFAAAGSQRLLMAWNNSTTGFQFFINSGGQIQPDLFTAFPTQSSVPSMRTWHQAVATYDGTTLRSYLDAVAQPTVAKAGPLTITQPIGIGADPSGAALSFEGFLAECSIYPSTLSAGQVTTHFTAMEQPSQSPVFTQVIGASGASGVSGGVAGAGVVDVTRFVSKTY